MSNDKPPAEQAAPTPGQPVRSEGLLPAEPDDLPEVAEEVSLDQQSEATRGIGAVPDNDKVKDALAETLRPPPPASKP